MAVRFLAIILVLLCVATPTRARSEDFSSWLQSFEQDAVAQGIAPDVAHTALANISPDDRVVELDQKQPETTVTFENYLIRIITAQRIDEGRDKLMQNAPLLHKVAQDYGVPPEIIVALWGVESTYGRLSGEYDILTSLVTLAYAGRRAEFFRTEALDTLRIIARDHIPPEDLRGSWAGAMGQCQFMPSTYLKYAVDYDQTGRPDIWNNTADVFASIANYLSNEGWRASGTWGREVELEEEVDPSEVGLTTTKSLAAWTAEGVHSADGASRPQRDLQASLIQPDGPNGRSFLVYDNYRALMKWNRSTYFATAVGILADRIKE